MVGTYEEPLVLNYQMRKKPRELFNFLVKQNKGGEFVLFKDEPKGDVIDDFFHLNLVSNPFLSSSDIAIGTALYYLLTKLSSNLDGELFWTATPKPFSTDNYEDNQFWVQYEGLTFFYDLPFKSLKQELSNLNIDLTSESIIKSLRRLHGCHYITITTKHGRGIDGDDSRFRSEYRHIRLYDGMIKRKLSGTWMKKDSIKRLIKSGKVDKWL